MKMLFTIPLALALTVAEAQTTNQNQIRHVETSLNHLTVLEFGESVSTIAVADTDSFRVEHHDDKVFIEPLREGVATNLFIWTESRQLTYELDPAGQLATMDVLIRTEPEPKPHPSAEPSDAEIRRMASLVQTQAMMGVQDITRDGSKSISDQVQVNLEQVYRAKDQLYIRYSIANRTKEPFRLTTPNVSVPLPTQVPISLLSLRNHQISAQTFDAFKTRPGGDLMVVQAESSAHDLAPGERTTGVLSIGSSQGNPPQIFQLNFGNDQGKPVTVEAVL